MEQHGLLARTGRTTTTRILTVRVYLSRFLEALFELFSVLVVVEAVQAPYLQPFLALILPRSREALHARPVEIQTALAVSAVSLVEPAAFQSELCRFDVHPAFQLVLVIGVCSSRLRLLESVLNRFDEDIRRVRSQSGVMAGAVLVIAHASATVLVVIEPVHFQRGITVPPFRSLI